MATILQGSSTDDINVNDGGPEFAEVFVIVWIGAMVVTLNSKLLGGQISLFQSVCVLGYCLTPLAIALLVCRIILIFGHSYFYFIIRMIVTAGGFLWATYGKCDLSDLNYFEDYSNSCTKNLQKKHKPKFFFLF